MLRKTMDSISKWLAESSSWLLMLIMALLLADFAARAAFRPIHGVQEAAMFVMIAVVYLGLAHAERTGGHIKVEFLVEAMPDRARKVTEFLGAVIGVIAVAIALWAVLLNTLTAYRTGQAVAGTTPLLIWPVKAIMVLAVGLYLIQIISNCIRRGLAIGRNGPYSDTAA